MNLNLRQAIVTRVKGKSTDELLQVIEDSIDGDERALPGLGVLFEIIWHNCDQAVQQNLVNALDKGLS